MLIKRYFSGATEILIMDDYMAKTPEENNLIKEHLDDIARRINERVNRERVLNENKK